MRITTKQTVVTNRYKPKYFAVAKDRKQGLVISSPSYDWNKLSLEEQRIQWVHCTNILWEKEKEGLINKEDLFPSLYQLMKNLKYTDSVIYSIRSLKDWEIPFTILSHSFLFTRGYFYKPAAEYIIRNIKILVEKLNKKNEIVSTVIVEKVSIKDSPISILIGHIQDLEDKMFQTTVDFTTWLKEKSVTKDQANKIIQFYLPMLKEINDAYTEKDEQVVEAYKRYGKSKIIHMLKWYINLIQALRTVEDKVITRTRKSKPKSPEKIVKNVRYMKKDEELGISSIEPKKILGSEILWAYNVKLRKLLVYQSKKGYTLGIEGTTIINFDSDRSHSKTLRKPELQLKEFLNRGKKPMLDYFDTIKSIASSVSGRINRDMILLKTY